MDAKQLRVMVRFRIHPGDDHRFMEIADECCRVVKHEEPGTLSYEWFFDTDGHRCTTLDTYASSDALLDHLGGRVGTELLPQLLQVSDLEGVEVFGVPSEQLVEATSAFHPVFHGHAFATTSF